MLGVTAVFEGFEMKSFEGNNVGDALMEQWEVVSDKELSVKPLDVDALWERVQYSTGDRKRWLRARRTNATEDDVNNGASDTESTENSDEEDDPERESPAEKTATATTSSF